MGAALLVLALSTPASADSFQGTFWSLSSDLVDYDANPATQTFHVLLSVDTSGYTGTGSFLDQVAVKVSSSLLGASLLDAPGGAANWVLHAGGISAGGCSGAGSGFECADAIVLTGITPVPGGTYDWEFSLTMANGALMTGPDEPSVKGRFVDASYRKVGALVSEHVTLTVTTPVPEPETYAMLLAGLALLGFARRRTRG